MTPASVTGLARFVVPAPAPERPAAVATERCEMCGEQIASEHLHLVDVQERALKCVCRPCGLLFTDVGAGGGRFRTSGQRWLRDSGGELTVAQWNLLQVPVGLVFVFRNSVLASYVACYPSPAGATESLLRPDTWDSLFAATPLAERLEPDVEALLVRRDRDEIRSYLVPIDACYELVARIRRTWRGFDGGAEARGEIDGFFARVAELSRPLQESG